MCDEHSRYLELILSLGLLRVIFVDRVFKIQRHMIHEITLSSYFVAGETEGLAELAAGALSTAVPP